MTSTKPNPDRRATDRQVAVAISSVQTRWAAAYFALGIGLIVVVAIIGSVYGRILQENHALKDDLHAIRVNLETRNARAGDTCLLDNAQTEALRAARLRPTAPLYRRLIADPPPNCAKLVVDLQRGIP